MSRKDESEAHRDRIRDISFAVQDEGDLVEVPEEEEDGNNMATQTEPSELTESREMTVKFAFTLGYPRGKS